MELAATPAMRASVMDRSTRLQREFQFTVTRNSSSKPEILRPPTSPTKEVEMYARNVRIKLKADSAREFTRLIEKEIIPKLSKQKGFKDEISFVSLERNE